MFSSIHAGAMEKHMNHERKILGNDGGSQVDATTRLPSTGNLAHRPQSILSRYSVSSLVSCLARGRVLGPAQGQVASRYPELLHWRQLFSTIVKQFPLLGKSPEACDDHTWGLG